MLKSKRGHKRYLFNFTAQMTNYLTTHLEYGRSRVKEPVLFCFFNLKHVGTIGVYPMGSVITKTLKEF